MNPLWAFNSTSLAQNSNPNFNQQQFLLLQQQIQQQQQQHMSNNFDMSLFNSASLHQQQQQNLLSTQNQMSHFNQTSSPSPINNPFSSSFSVNSLLSSNPISSTPDKLAQKQLQQQHQHQQLAAAVFTQHLAAAMANYRLQQQTYLNQQKRQPLYPINESAFQQPPSSKRIKLNEIGEANSMEHMSNNGLNLSICSVSSPTSLSSSSSSSTSGAGSMIYEYNSNNQQNLFNLNRFSANNGLHQYDSSLGSSSSTSSTSSISLNESGEYATPNNPIDSEMQQLADVGNNMDRVSPVEINQKCKFFIVYWFSVVKLLFFIKFKSC